MALVADEQAAVAVQPGEGALGDPPVAAEALARVDAAAGDARDDVPAPERVAAAAEVVRLVGVELRGAPARAARPVARPLERRDGVDQALEDGALVHVR